MDDMAHTHGTHKRPDKSQAHPVDARAKRDDSKSQSPDITGHAANLAAKKWRE
jgi:hypothetical protein